MVEYQVVFRLHGPIQIKTEYNFGNAKLSPKLNVEGISGILKFNYDANDREEAQEIAQSRLKENARIIAGALTFTFEEGIEVGHSYKVARADAPYKEQTDSTLSPDSYLLSIAKQVYENIYDDIKTNENLKRAFNWYSYGLSTEIAEDRLVAFWTGAESLVQTKTIDMNLTNEQRESIDEAKDIALQHFEDNTDLKDWVSGHFGRLLSSSKNEDGDEAVLRVAEDKIDGSQFSEEIDTVVETIYNNRNAIVHQGIHIDKAVSEANLAEKLLRELLIASLQNAFTNFISDSKPDRVGSPIIYYEEALPRVFEESYDLKLSNDEIKERLFALTSDLREAYRFPTQNFAGEDEPLSQLKEDLFQLNPEYDFERNN